MKELKQVKQFWMIDEFSPTQSIVHEINNVYIKKSDNTKDDKIVCVLEEDEFNKICWDRDDKNKNHISRMNHYFHSCFSNLKSFDKFNTDNKASKKMYVRKAYTL